MEPRIYTLSEEETAEWCQPGDDGAEAQSFLKRALSANEPKGRRLEVYAHDARLLAAFDVA